MGMGMEMGMGDEDGDGDGDGDTVCCLYSRCVLTDYQSARGRGR